MSLAEFEPTIPASERPQTHALVRMAKGLDIADIYMLQNVINWQNAEGGIS